MPEAQTLDLGQARTLHLVSEGRGVPIVLIHGALATHTDWMGPVFAEFARRGRVIALDRPGRGGSRRGRFEGAPGAQARQIRDGLQRLGVRRPLLVGHSLGGLVSLAYAADFPDEVAGLVLVAPLGFPEVRLVEHGWLAPRSAPLLGPLLAEVGRWSFDPLLLRQVQRLMFAPQTPPEDWVARYPYHEVLTSEHMVAEGEDAAAIAPNSPVGLVNLGSVVAPVHILSGDKDQIVLPSRHAQRLHAALPGSKLDMLSGVGHMAHHAAPDALIGAVDQMLNRMVSEIS